MGSIDNLFDKEQNEGIFRVPATIEDTSAIKSWLNRVRENAVDTPIIIKEGKYSKRESGISILHCSRKVLYYEGFIPLGLIRPNKGEEFIFGQRLHYVSPLSLAQVLSWAYQKPIEEILLSESQVQENAKKLDTEAKLEYLFKAYSGVYWFELFRKKHSNLGKKHKIPIIRTSYLIRKSEACEHFIIDKMNTLRKLDDKGFLIESNFDSVYKKNNLFINPKGFAKLLALTYGVNLQDILIEDDYWGELADSFFVNRLFPYLDEHNIVPEQKYPPKEAAKLTGIDVDVIASARKRGRLNAKRQRKGYSNQHGTYHQFKGIDIAIHALRYISRDFGGHYGREDVANLFGVEDIEVDRLNFKKSDMDFYSRQYYVFPLYEQVTNIARERALNPPSEVAISCGDFRFMLRSHQKKAYLNAYGLPMFDDQCIEHFQQQIEESDFHPDCTIIQTPHLNLKVEKINPPYNWKFTHIITSINFIESAIKYA